MNHEHASTITKGKAATNNLDGGNIQISSFVLAYCFSEYMILKQKDKVNAMAIDNDKKYNILELYANAVLLNDTLILAIYKTNIVNLDMIKVILYIGAARHGSE